VEVVVALDGMGADRAPEAPVRGALAAAGPGVRILLVGDEEALRAELDRQGGAASERIEVVHAPDRIGPDEDGVKAARSKRDSSMVVACRLVAEGRAQAVVSGGNTGAMLAAATFVLRRVPGVIRPGIAVVLPSAAGPVVLIDAGANADCRPEYLGQFALMGALFARDVMRIPDPSLGLLSIGEEDAKGSELVHAARPLLAALPGFIGNIEGRDIPRGTARVIVTDGFTGNVALKLYEGAASVMFREVAAALRSSPRGRLGGLLARPALRAMRRRFDHEEYGGAYLLGVRGLAVIGHGSTDGRGLANAVRLAAVGVREELVARLEAGLAGSRTPAERVG
jgi:phosphate acyltransferase